MAARIALIADDELAVIQVKEDWALLLRKTAECIFDKHTENIQADPKHAERVHEARRDMLKDIYGNRKILDLPKHKEAA
jgi:plasmid rolling circle replication initiator protein Rep